jgi:hypothetical protein
MPVDEGQVRLARQRMLSSVILTIISAIFIVIWFTHWFEYRRRYFIQDYFNAPL